MNRTLAGLQASLAMLACVLAAPSAEAALIQFNFDKFATAAALSGPNLTETARANPEDCADGAGGDRCGTQFTFSNGGVAVDITAFDDTGSTYVWYDLKGFGARGGLGSAPKADLCCGANDNNWIADGEGLFLDFGGQTVTLKQLIVYENHVPILVGDDITVNGAAYAIMSDAATINETGKTFKLSMAKSSSADEWYLGGMIIEVGDPPGGNVPEPASLLLIGIGLAGLGVARRRRAGA